jgi:hypothetical protein
MHRDHLAMTTLRVVRRPDGVIELRRRRLRDSRYVKDAALLVGLCFVCLGFIAALATILVETPMLLAATAALVLPVVPAVLLARSAELAPASAGSRSPRGPDGAA